MANGSKTAFELGGIPETLLWNLYYRALEARRPDAVLRNSMKVLRLQEYAPRSLRRPWTLQQSLFTHPAPF
jgi:hypothetical protein